jgi:hypothetical protein
MAETVAKGTARQRRRRGRQKGACGASPQKLDGLEKLIRLAMLGLTLALGGLVPVARSYELGSACELCKRLVSTWRDKHPDPYKRGMPQYLPSEGMCPRTANEGLQQICILWEAGRCRVWDRNPFLSREDATMFHGEIRNPFVKAFEFPHVKLSDEYVHTRNIVLDRFLRKGTDRENRRCEELVEWLRNSVPFRELLLRGCKFTSVTGAVTWQQDCPPDMICGCLRNDEGTPFCTARSEKESRCLSAGMPQ